MNQVVVAYWELFGNTQEMAELIGQGVRDAGQSVSVIPVDEMKAAAIPERIPGLYTQLGCPSMGAEELEETIMEPFVEEVGFAGGKKIALFGSYGWGDGEWMRNLQHGWRMQEHRYSEEKMQSVEAPITRQKR